MRKLKKGTKLVADRVIRGERLMVPISGSHDEMNGMLNLNETASLVYDLALKGKNDEEIVKEIQACFEVDADTARKDIMDIIDTLIEEELLQEA